MTQHCSIVLCMVILYWDCQVMVLTGPVHWLGANGRQPVLGKGLIGVEARGTQHLVWNFYMCTERAGVMPADVVTICTSFIRSVLEYSCQVWHTRLMLQQSDQLEVVQQRAVRGAHPDMSYQEAVQETGWEMLECRRVTLCKRFFNDMLNLDDRLHSLLPLHRHWPCTLRKGIKWCIPLC